jgi:hypothetical protein
MNPRRQPEPVIRDMNVKDAGEVVVFRFMEQADSLTDTGKLSIHCGLPAMKLADRWSMMDS